MPSTSTGSWLAVASLGISTFASVTTEFMPVGLLPAIAAGLRVSEGTAGLMVTVPGFIGALAGPLVTLSANRLDRRAVLLLLSALLVASNLIAALAPNIGSMLLARALLGLCVGGFWTLAPGVAGHLVPAPLMARAMSYIIAGISAATVAGVPATALIGNYFGWRAAFLAIAVLAGIVLAVQLRVLPRLAAGQVTHGRDLLLPLIDPGARTVLIATVLIVLAHFSAYTYLQPMLRQLFGLKPAAIAPLLLIYGVMGLVGTLAGGRLVAIGARNAMFCAAVLIGAVLFVSVLVGGNAVMATIVVAAWGIGFGLIPVSVTAWMIERLPGAIDPGQAMVVVAFQVAICGGSLLGGVIADRFGISSTLLLSGLLAAVCAIVAVARRPARAVVNSC